MMKLNFKSARVLVVGDLMLDRYWYGPVSRVSPEAPVPVVKVNQVEDRLGGAGNVALNVVALGAEASLKGVVGDDETGEHLVSKLESVGVQTYVMKQKGAPTITKLRILSQHQQLLRCDFEEPLSTHIDQAAFLKTYQAALDGCEVVVLSDYAKGTLFDTNQLIQIARGAGKRVLVDPKGVDFSLYHNASVLTPNLKEFEAVVGPCQNEKDIALKAKKLCAQHEITAILVTRGAEGMTLIHRNGDEVHIPTVAREVYDVTGAGDTVIATMAVALASGLDYADAMIVANAAAGIVVGKMGAATVSLPELKATMMPDSHNIRGVLSEEQLEIAVEAARARGEKIVFTNGCFDILHAGHVNYLQLAHEEGDRLIVAVNTDESVSKNKGPNRPVNRLDRRMLVLAGLESVDWVVSFGDETPVRLLEKLKPDVLVKGGDYSIDEVVGHDLVEAYGGTIKVLGHVEGLSTTKTLDKLSKK